MLSTLDHIIIAVEDLNHAEQNYKKIFGIKPAWRGAVSYTHLRAHET